MKKVSIFLILLTVTMTAIRVDEIKDLLMLLSICMLFYLFGFYVIKKINLYFQRKRLENDFASIFTDEFLERLKKELTISKFKNELEKIRRSELYSIQSEQEATKNRTFNDLDLTLKQMTFNEIVNDPDHHFENCFVTNFDLIHHECRSDELSYSRKYYETIFNKILRKKLFLMIFEIDLFPLQ